jgi:peptide/nickel transport system substrate-binding protein
VIPTTGAYQINMCIRDDNPLGDVRVRQALNHATDREAINQLIFEGESTVAWSLVPEDDPLYNDELTGIYEYDPERARTLLAEAGYPDGFELTAVTTQLDQRLHEVLQAQWAEVGVNTNITLTQDLVTDWYTANGGKGQINAVPLLRLPTEDFTRNFSSTAFANVCKTPVPDIDACAADLSALEQGTDAYLERYQECQKVVVEDTVFGVLTVFQIQVQGVNTDRIGNLVYQRDPLSQSQPDVTKVYIRA